MPVAEPLPARSHAASAVRSLLEIDGEGFVPGEDVEVAAIVSSSSAAPDGTARGLVDSAAIGVPLLGLVLIGDVSGTVAVRHLS